MYSWIAATRWRKARRFSALLASCCTFSSLRALHPSLTARSRPLMQLWRQEVGVHIHRLRSWKEM